MRESAYASTPAPYRVKLFSLTTVFFDEVKMVVKLIFLTSLNSRACARKCIYILVGRYVLLQTHRFGDALAATHK